MAVAINFKAKQTTDQLYVVVNELTGTYDASTNLGGYGAPNPIVGAALSAQLIFTKLGDTTSYTVNIFTSGFPTTDKTKTVSIPYTSFGGAAGDKMPNGIWNVEYIVTFPNSITTHNDFYFAFVEGLSCCISKTRQEVPVPKNFSCKCTCGGQEKCSKCKTITIATLGALYDAICPLLECDKLDKASEVIAYLQAWCDCNCTTC